MYIPELFNGFLYDIRPYISNYFEYDTYMLVEVEKDDIKEEFKCRTLDNFREQIKHLYDNSLMLYNCPINLILNGNDHYYLYDEDGIKIKFKLIVGGVL